MISTIKGGKSNSHIRANIMKPSWYMKEKEKEIKPIINNTISNQNLQNAGKKVKLIIIKTYHNTNYNNKNLPQYEL